MNTVMFLLLLRLCTLLLDIFKAKEDGNSISGLGNASDEDGNITSTSLSCSSIGFGSRVLEELSYVHLETGSP